MLNNKKFLEELNTLIEDTNLSDEQYIEEGIKLLEKYNIEPTELNIERYLG